MAPPSSVPEWAHPGFQPKTVKEMQDVKPGLQHQMEYDPIDDVTADGKPYKAAGKLEGKNAVITGADSGIGRATAILYALEGASLYLHYFEKEQKDVDKLNDYLKKKSPNTKVEWISADLSKREEVEKVAEGAKKYFNGQIDILFNNHATQQEVESLTELSDEQWTHVFDTNIHAFYRLTKALLPNMPWGASIINNASINPFVGHPKLVDYTSTKGAIVAFTRALSNQIVKEKGVRVNCICPGPIWTPLVVATMGKDSMESFGVTTSIGRAGQPVEMATVCVFLASADSSYITAQMIHANGGAPY